MEQTDHGQMFEESCSKNFGSCCEYHDGQLTFSWEAEAENILEHPLNTIVLLLYN